MHPMAETANDERRALEGRIRELESELLRLHQVLDLWSETTEPTELTER